MTLQTEAVRPAAMAAAAPELDANTVILYFGNDWMAENRTSSHQIARELAKKFRVFYIECPGWRAPRGSARDLKKMFAKVWRFLRGTRRVDHGIRLRTLFQIPFHRYAAVRRFNRGLIRLTLFAMKVRYGIRNPIAWFHIPHVPFLVGNLGERLAVYYCTDDFSAYPGVHAETVRAMDDETARRADLVFVTSETLLAGKQALNPTAYVSPHGVEFDHFAKAQSAGTTIPEDLRRLDGPVIGFFGLIESFIDLDMIDWLAEQRPGWHFVLLGRVAVAPERLPQRPNVHFLGKRPYESLPAYAKRFNACVIPYRHGNWSFHANPLKLREYLATGRPIVSVDTPQIRKFRDVVEIAANREEFLQRLDKCIDHPSTAAEIENRMNRVAECSWAARTASVVDTIRAHC